MSSYVISVANGSGVYRHIRISSIASLQVLSDAILSAYDLTDASAPAFLPVSEVEPGKPNKYSRNNTKTTTAMRRVMLIDSPFADVGRMVFTTSVPAFTFNCRRIKTTDEEVAEPQVIRSSGSLASGAYRLRRMLRELNERPEALEFLRATLEINLMPMQTRGLIVEYATAAVNLYGVVPLVFVHDLFKAQQQEISLAAFIIYCVLLHQGDEPILYIMGEDGHECGKESTGTMDNNYLVHYDVREAEAFDAVRRQQADKPFYAPGAEELLRYADEDFVDQTPQYLEVRAFLVQLGMDPKHVESLLEEIVYEIRCGNNGVNMLLEMLDEQGITLESLKQTNELLALFSDLINNTRMYDNCGHTPLEMAALYGEREPRVLSYPLSPQPKPGRNSPCPCGSGEKYKHCCGRGHQN